MDHWLKISLPASCMLCIMFTDVPMLPSNYVLRSYPESPIDGKLLTLSCTEEHGYDINAAQWFRNSQKIFQTSDSNKTYLLDPSVNSTEYLSVSKRIITINTSTTQHNVTLRINSKMDNTTVWKCRTGQDSSNNITIFVIDEGTTNNEQTTFGGPIDSTTSSGEETHLVAIIAASISGNVILIIVVTVLSCLLVRSRRNQNRDDVTLESNANVNDYSTLSHDNVSDNQYSDIKRENRITECTHRGDPGYYNTVVAEGDGYENPPLSTNHN